VGSLNEIDDGNLLLSFVQVYSQAAYIAEYALGKVDDTRSSSDKKGCFMAIEV
jgi:hypothetical protein